MIIYRTKYFGIHTDRVRALAEQIGRGKNLEEKKIHDELFGKSKESIRSLKLGVENIRKKHPKLFDLLKDKEVSQDTKREFLSYPEFNDLNKRYTEAKNKLTVPVNNEDFYKNIEEKIRRDEKIRNLHDLFSERRSPLNYLRDRKIQKEMEKYVLDHGLVKAVHKDLWKETPTAPTGWKLNRHNTYADHDRNGIGEVYLDIHDRNRPDQFGHEIDHIVFGHEVLDSAVAANKSRMEHKLTDKNILKSADEILNWVNVIQNEHNTADRGLVMRPYLSSKSVTKQDLKRYSKNKTDYNLTLQGYIPPSLDYHTDPATIKKIKEHVKEQRAIENYLNTDRKWL